MSGYCKGCGNTICICKDVAAQSTYETERDEAAPPYTGETCSSARRWAWLDGADWAWAKAQGEIARAENFEATRIIAERDQARATADAMMGDAMCARAEVSQMSELVKDMTNRENTLESHVRQLNDKSMALEAQVRKLEGELNYWRETARNNQYEAQELAGYRDQWRDRALKLKAALERICKACAADQLYIHNVASEALAEFEETTKTKG